MIEPPRQSAIDALPDLTAVQRVGLEAGNVEGLTASRKALAARIALAYAALRESVDEVRRMAIRREGD